MGDCIINLDNSCWFEKCKNSLPLKKSQSHIEPHLMYTHEKNMDSNEVKFIEELYKRHDKKKNNPKTQKTREDNCMHAEQVCVLEIES